MTGKTRAPRLSTEDRRNQILDSGVRLILGQGVARCTLETIAAEAGISKALIYRHFSSREELLKAVIQREYRLLRDLDIGAPSESLSYEEALRHIHPRTFRYLLERGPVVRAMFNDRSVANLLRDYDSRARSQTIDYYIRKIARTYAVPEELAQLGVLMTINAPVGAARALKAFRFGPEEAADFWTTFILGGWAAISATDKLKRP